MNRQSARSSLTPVRLAGVAAVIVVLVLMVLNTKFLTPQEVKALQPKQFDPAAEAATLFARAEKEVPSSAAPLADVVTAIQADPAAAAKKYSAVSAAEGSYAFIATAKGKVTEASAESLQLDVPGVPAATTVIVPLKTAVNGTAVRDAMGFKFADAPGQTQYQYVGDELKKLMQRKVAQLGDPAALKGKEVTVEGVVPLIVSSGPPPAAKPVNLQPVSIEVGS
jgi:predicted lipoprotein